GRRQKRGGGGGKTPAGRQAPRAAGFRPAVCLQYGDRNTCVSDGVVWNCPTAWSATAAPLPTPTASSPPSRSSAALASPWATAFAASCCPLLKAVPSPASQSRAYSTKSAQYTASEWT